MNGDLCSCVLSLIRCRRRAIRGPVVLSSDAVMEWEGRGEQRGEQRAEQRSILRVLRARFGGSVPADLEAALATLTAEERGHWLETAATAHSLEAFRTLVGRPAE